MLRFTASRSFSSPPVSSAAGSSSPACHNRANRPPCASSAAGDRVTSRRTAFVVAHRLATAARADRVVVLHGGRIAEQGAPAALLAQGGRFARLWQAGELEPPADDTGDDENDLDGVNLSTRSA